MTSHGFGGAKLESGKATSETIDQIAECISKKPGVLWAHVVHEGFYYDSYEARAEMRNDRRIQNRYDLLIETTGKCDWEAIAKCARDLGHGITIERITVKDKSWHKGKPGKHPKEEASS